MREKGNNMLIVGTEVFDLLTKSKATIEEVVPEEHRYRINNDYLNGWRFFSEVDYVTETL